MLIQFIKDRIAYKVFKCKKCGAKVYRNRKASITPKERGICALCAYMPSDEEVEE